jgi:hypothetical protein
VVDVGGLEHRLGCGIDAGGPAQARSQAGGDMTRWRPDGGPGVNVRDNGRRRPGAVPSGGDGRRWRWRPAADGQRRYGCRVKTEVGHGGTVGAARRE